MPAASLKARAGAFRRVLIVSKKTRLQFELQRQGLASPHELQRLGFDVDRLRSADAAHTLTLENVLGVLAAHRVDYQLEFAKNLRAIPAKVDLVITVGGDGTVLETAQLINSSIPVLAVNSDPLTSTGKLCSVAFHRNVDFNRIFASLLQGHFTYQTRQRISIDIIDAKQHVTRLPRPALNEVFYSEVDPNRPSKQEITVVCADGDEVPVCSMLRSSGVIVATGSGSTAWIKSASALHPKDVERVLKAAECQPRIEGDAKAHYSRLAQRLNEECVFHPADMRVRYQVRDPMLSYSQDDAGEDETPYGGFALSVSIRSLGFNSTLALDGLFKHPVAYGDTAVMRIDPEVSLKCINL